VPTSRARSAFAVTNRRGRPVDFPDVPIWGPAVPFVGRRGRPNGARVVNGLRHSGGVWGWEERNRTVLVEKNPAN